jgi:hypothetical protein
MDFLMMTQSQTARRARFAAPALAALLFLAACESDTTAPPPQAGELEIDASSNTDFVYFSFADDGTVTVTNPSSSSAWDLAFRRYSLRLNGGVAGTKGVTGFNLENNVGATDAQVLAFTAENQQPAFDAVGAADIPASGFTSEVLAPDVTGWFRPTAAGLVPNPAAVWKLRRASGAGSGAYAAIRVEAIVNDPSLSQADGMRGITFGYRLQTAPGTLGAAQTVAVDLSTLTEAGVNLATGAVVTPTAGDCSWDIKVTRAYTFDVNAACLAGTFPFDASETFAAVTRADNALEYGAFVALISGPVPNSIEDPSGVFLYNLAGDNRLSPTFNTYLIRVGTSVYKLQVVSYYSATGTAGFPTIRYTRIQ